MSLSETAVTFGSNTYAISLVCEVEVLGDLSVFSQAVTVPVPFLGDTVSQISACT